MRWRDPEQDTRAHGWQLRDRRGRRGARLPARPPRERRWRIRDQREMQQHSPAFMGLAFV